MTVLRDAAYLIDSNGIVAVAVRTPENVERAVRDGWTRHNDGWLTSTGTFQRGITTGELTHMMIDVGFELVFSGWGNRDFSLVAGIYSPLLEDY